MNAETKLIIQNQMITNNLLKLLVAKSMTNSTPLIIDIANALDEAADDIVKSRLAFEKIDNL